MSQKAAQRVRKKRRQGARDKKFANRGMAIKNAPDKPKAKGKK